MKKLYLGSLFLIFALANYGNAQTATWSTDLPEKSSWEYISPYGQLLLVSENNLTSINSEDGQVVWTKSVPQNLMYNEVSQFENTPYFQIKRGGEKMLLDYRTGESILESSAIKIPRLDTLIILPQSDLLVLSGINQSASHELAIYDLAAKKVLWRDHSNELLQSAVLTKDKDVLFCTSSKLYLIDGESGSMKWQASKEAGSVADLFLDSYRDLAFVASHRPGSTVIQTKYQGYSLKTGEPTWSSSLAVAGPIFPVNFVKGGVVINTSVPLAVKANLLDPYTQEGVWGNKGRGIKVKSPPKHAIEFEQGTLLVFRNKIGPRYIGFVDSENQVKVENVEMRGDIYLCSTYGKQILIVGKKDFKIIDPLYGTDNGNSIKTELSLIDQHGDNLCLFDKSKSILYKYNLKSGESAELVKKLKTEAKSNIEYLEVTESGVLLSSSEELILIDFEGKVVYDKVFNVPANRHLNDLEKAKNVARSYEQSTWGDELVDDSDDLRIAINKLKADGSSFEVKANRFSSPSEYTYLVTEENEVLVFNKIKISTGEIESQIQMGSSKEVSYYVDFTLNKLFVVESGIILNQYDF
ncbi:PQQ-like beta-propeller repeat protein [Fulvivirga maritima]|uniref:outer membrane protein assembly factor BamB family protein n=1 Tax=Fulvivirga maritima TaxID=2904247 RepID=UPI001F329CFD|nr:PQQ-binding-like beta-propeller repeat protein [Fulvivirga maritima]UII27100.1 PQQ-like beta-propeller repeat protein [Fulvivirga maritima]